MKMTSATIAKAIKEAKTLKKRIESPDSDHGGLNLGISPRGIATWNLRTRDPSGNPKRINLGRYEDLGIAAARDAARRARVKVQNGEDPVSEKRQRRKAGADLRAGVGTLSALFDTYEARGKPPKTWHTGAGRQRVERVFAPLLGSSVADMTSAAIVQALDDYQGSANAAKNGLRALKPVLGWAAERDLAPENLTLVQPRGGLKKRKRVLTKEELKILLPLLRRWKTAHGPAMLYMLLTLARRGEVEGLTWGEIDFAEATWTLPADRQKNTSSGSREMEDIVVPLSAPALRLLQDLRPQCLASTTLVFGGTEGRPLSNWDRAQKRIFAASDTSGWHRHDLRRTGATLLGNLGTPPHVISAALRHMTTSNPLQDTYNRSRYDGEVREAFARLGGHLFNLASKPQDQPDFYGERQTVLVSALGSGVSGADTEYVYYDDFEYYDRSDE